MVIEAVSEIMAAIGPAEDDILAVLRTDEQEWVLRYDEADVEVSVVEGEDRIVFSALCGAPPRDRISAVHAALLRFNAIWRDTGSIRMATVGAEGEVALMVDMFAGHATRQHVALVAKNVADRAVAWRYVVEAGAPGDAPPPASDHTDSLLFRP